MPSPLLHGRLELYFRAFSKRNTVDRSASVHTWNGVFAQITFFYTMYVPSSHTPQPIQWKDSLLLDVLLQTPQPLLRLLQHLVLLANRESQPILGKVSVFISKELGGRDGRNTKLTDAEPHELEIPWAVGNVWREWVVFGQLHLGEVDEDEIAAFGFRILVVLLVVVSISV